jgi:hypothetical protein
LGREALMSTTPSRSPFGVFYRSPLGVRTRPSGQIDLWRIGDTNIPLIRFVSAVGGGYSFCGADPVDGGNIFWCNFVKSPTEMSLATLPDSFYFSQVRSAYYNGIYALSAIRYDGTNSYYKIFTSTNREDWTERYSAAHLGNDAMVFLKDGFTATLSGFVAWGVGPTTNFIVESSDGVNWSISSIPYNRALRYNPMTDQVSTGAEGDPWMYGYDEPNGIMVGIGNTVIAGYDFSTWPPTPIYNREASTKIHASTNGTSWSLVYTASHNLTCCSAGGGQMVAATSRSGQIFYSPDQGATWGGVDFGNVSSTAVQAISYLNGVFVLYGQSFAADLAGVFRTSVLILKDGVLSAKRPDSYISP